MRLVRFLAAYVTMTIVVILAGTVLALLACVAGELGKRSGRYHSSGWEAVGR